jgi:glyoxylase-like metal-dependent hydrolase (beta-lactamase superfamily II)
MTLLRISRILAATAALGAFGIQARAQAPTPPPPATQPLQYDRIEIRSTQIAPGFYTMTGSPNVDPGHLDAAGGTVGVYVGTNGILLVDATYAPLSDKLIAAIRAISPAPILYLIDTHEHPDHTSGNAPIAHEGALLFSTENARNVIEQQELPTIAALLNDVAAESDPARIPTVTFGMGHPVKIAMDQETVDLIAMPPGHTNGDAIVRFEKEDVIMIGDFYRNYQYPFVDSIHGGTFKGMLEAIAELMTIAGPDTKLIPGHGTPITRADLPTYRDLILYVETAVRRRIEQKQSLQQILAAKITAPFDAKVPGSGLPSQLVPGGTDADQFVTQVYNELTGEQTTVQEH